MRNVLACCGLHKDCEKERLPDSESQAIEYYDDDELDVFKSRSSDSYSFEEIEQFREILYTLWESDVPGWLYSLQMRGVEIPDNLKEEALLMLEDSALR
ncbi:hypothetical protein FACS18947_6560 [Bacteroidia bacterium]|nr:hypothetical protein FACS18947_6560 [Bacteroidia bacterium]